MRIVVLILGLVVPGVAIGLAGDEPSPTATEAPDQSAEAGAQESYANTLRWTTASEVDNFGFDIYRATDEEGPFERITPQPIAGAGTTDEPQSYVFADDTIDPTQGYWYYIESISINGVRERFSPVTFAKPKKPAPAPTPTPEPAPE